MSDDVNYEGPNPNTESPHGKCKPEIADWMKRQAEKGNRGFVRYKKVF